MRDSLSYGDPEDEGEYQDSHYILALGHWRLSILDLSKFGKQLMFNDIKPASPYFFRILQEL